MGDEEIFIFLSNQLNSNVLIIIIIIIIIVKFELVPDLLVQSQDGDLLKF